MAFVVFFFLKKNQQSPEQFPKFDDECEECTGNYKSYVQNLLKCKIFHRKYHCQNSIDFEIDTILFGMKLGL